MRSARSGPLPRSGAGASRQPPGPESRGQVPGDAGRYNPCLRTPHPSRSAALDALHLSRLRLSRSLPRAGPRRPCASGRGSDLVDPGPGGGGRDRASGQRRGVGHDGARAAPRRRRRRGGGARRGHPRGPSDDPPGSRSTGRARLGDPGRADQRRGRRRAPDRPPRRDHGTARRRLDPRLRGGRHRALARRRRGSEPERQGDHAPDRWQGRAGGCGAHARGGDLPAARAGAGRGDRGGRPLLPRRGPRALLRHPLRGRRPEPPRAPRAEHAGARGRRSGPDRARARRGRAGGVRRAARIAGCATPRPERSRRASGRDAGPRSDPGAREPREHPRRGHLRRRALRWDRSPADGVPLSGANRVPLRGGAVPVCTGADRRHGRPPGDDPDARHRRRQAAPVLPHTQGSPTPPSGGAGCA